MATLCIWHGYLLGGSGSNIYTVNVAAEWVRAGHTVILMCQEPHPERAPYVNEWLRVSGGAVVERHELAPQTAAGKCIVVQADIGSLLPVYCLDRYEGFDIVKRFVDLTAEELERYVEGNRQALQYVLGEFAPSGVLINHVVMGPESLRPLLEAADVPYVVKVHGSELEYAITEDARYIEPARSGLRGARRVLSGSDHITRRTVELLGEECCGDRIEVVPPGVDMELFAPVERAEFETARDDLVAVVRDREAMSKGRSVENDEAFLRTVADGVANIAPRLAALHGSYQERDIEIGVANALAGIDFATEPVAAFVGKAIRQKGAQLVFAAWPLVLREVPNARLIVTGFGLMREGWNAIVHALSTGNRELLAELVAHGNALDGGADEPLAHVREFLQRAGGDDAFWSAAQGMAQRVHFTGQVDHAVLSRLWPLCRCSIVPSIFPEAFGMVTAEAAACGCLPVVADHTGLADVARELRAGYPDWARGLLGFDLGSGTAVEDLAAILIRLLSLTPEEHHELAGAARTVVGDEWSWTGIGRRIEAAFDPVHAVS